jgi:hypothetical protein
MEMNQTGMIDRPTVILHTITAPYNGRKYSNRCIMHKTLNKKELQIYQYQQIICIKIH